MAVLDVIEAEGLQQHAFETGMYFLSELNKLKDRYEPIGDVRGHGLFIGIEFVKNRFTKEPDTLLANAIKNQLREQFILVSTDGPYDNVVKIKPPMCFNKLNSDVVASQIEQCLIGL
ncbi:MAG: aminotransferase class III-fold pyridoxal phosphate-dependent enzyme [Bacteroidales bacterium]